MAEKTQGGWRERVFFTDQAWDRLEALADKMSVDPRTTIRMLVAISMAQFETMLGAAQSPRMRTAVEEDLTESGEGMIADILAHPDGSIIRKNGA
jgi:hypothetical protein